MEPTNNLWRPAQNFRGARASRVLAKASRLRELPCGVAAELVHPFPYDAAGKFVLAGRQNQHAGRARSTESAARIPTPFSTN